MDVGAVLGPLALPDIEVLGDLGVRAPPLGQRTALVVVPARGRSYETLLGELLDDEDALRPQEAPPAAEPKGTLAPFDYYYEPLAKFSITTGLIGGVAVVQRYGGHRSIGDEAFKSW